MNNTFRSDLFVAWTNGFTRFLLRAFVVVLPIALGTLGVLIGFDFILVILLAIPLAILIISQPYWGLIVIFASFPVQILYPSIPILTSILPLIGLVTLGAYLVQSRAKTPAKFEQSTPARKVPAQYIFAVLFVLWIFLTNPQAAVFSQDRNWLWTYLQLLMLMWLSSKLLGLKQLKQLAQVYLVTATISAAVSIGQFLQSEGFSRATAAGGLAQNQNEQAMYLVVGVLFWFYLFFEPDTRNKWSSNSLLTIPLLGILAVLVFGVFASVSRTGLTALFVGSSLILLLIRNDDPANRNRFVLRYVVAISIAVIVIITIPDELLRILFEGALELKDNFLNAETSLNRIALWRAGLKMWQTAPLIGVGIGQYRFFYDKFLESLIWYKGVGPAHNIYVSLLAETGVVGLGLYISWLGSTLIDLVRVYQKETKLKAIAGTWLSIFVIFILFSMTNNFEYFKLIWFVAGVSISLSTMISWNASQAVENEPPSGAFT